MIDAGCLPGICERLPIRLRLVLASARIEDRGGPHLTSSFRANSVNATLLVGLVFLVLLALEWRLEFKSIRAASIVLALILLDFYQPISLRAARQALDVPRSERVFQSSPVPADAEYASGVLTMLREVREEVQAGSGSRLLCILVLTWFACTPLYRRSGISPRPTQERR